MASTPDVLIVANSAAGSVDEQVIADVMAGVKGNSEFRLRATQSRDDLDAAFADGVPGRVLVLGGDGSVHAVVNALRDSGQLGDTVLGLIPTGTGNDLARALGLPMEIPAAVEVALGESTRTLDLLDASDGPAVINAVHVGIGAEAAQAGQSFKPMLGAAGYTVGAAMAGVRSSGWEVSVEVDGTEIVAPTESVLMVAVTVGSSIGGGTPIAPDAEVDDRRAEVVVSLATGPLARVGYAKDLRTGRHTERDDVLAARGTSVRVSGSPFPVNTDGELEEDVTDRTWKLRPSAWTAAVPT